MSTDKFVICPSCGAIVRKGESFCSYCGKNPSEPVKTNFDIPLPSQEKVSEQKQGAFTLYPNNQMPNQYPMGLEDQLRNRYEIRKKLRWLQIFSSLSCIAGEIPIFLILTIYFAVKLKKLGVQSKVLIYSVIMAIIGTVLNILMIYFLFFTNLFGNNI